MAVVVISKIKHKNGVSPVMDAADIEMPDGSRLSDFNPSVGEEVLEEIESLKAQDQYIATVAGQVIERVTALETPAKKVDLSNFATGEIVETKVDDTKVTYTFNFDENGVPTSITDSNGGTTELVGFGQMSYKSAEGASF